MAVAIKCERQRQISLSISVLCGRKFTQLPNISAIAHLPEAKIRPMDREACLCQIIPSAIRQLAEADFFSPPPPTPTVRPGMYDRGEPAEVRQSTDEGGYASANEKGLDIRDPVLEPGGVFIFT